MPAADRIELNHATQDLERFEQRVKELDSAITELSAADEDAKPLMKTPGIALFSSVALSSRIAGIERFKQPRALANYFGLKPSKIARVAVMRRMATIIWHMLTKRKTWAEVRSLGIGLAT